MSKYKGSKIEGVLFTRFRIDVPTGNITELFGWTNTGIDFITEALYIGLQTAKSDAEARRVHANEKANHLRRFKLRRTTEEEKTDIENAESLSRKMAKRIVDIETLLNLFQNRAWKTVADVNQSVKMAQEYINVNLLDRDAEYEVSPILIGWTDPENKFYHVEDDFSISEWRLAPMGYENKDDGSIEVSYQLFKAPYFDGPGKRISMFETDKDKLVMVISDESNPTPFFADRDEAIKHARNLIANEQDRLHQMITDLDKLEVA